MGIWVTTNSVTGSEDYVDLTDEQIAAIDAAVESRTSIDITRKQYSDWYLLRNKRRPGILGWAAIKEDD